MPDANPNFLVWLSFILILVFNCLDFWDHHTPPLGKTVFPLVEAVVMRALAKDPKQRFANVQAFAV
jgi:hypothetical protein